jgi:hypothetical protein
VVAGVVEEGPERSRDAPAGEAAGGFVDVVVDVAGGDIVAGARCSGRPEHAGGPQRDARLQTDTVVVLGSEGVQLEELPRPVLVRTVARVGVVVEVVEHRRAARHRLQHVPKVAENVGPDDVPVVVDEGLLGVHLEAVDVEVVQPEVGQHLAQLPLAVDHAEVGVEPRLLHRAGALGAAGLVVLPELGERLAQRREARIGVAVEAVAALMVLGVVGFDRVGVELLLDIGREPRIVVRAEGLEGREVAGTGTESHAVEGHQRDAGELQRGPARRRLLVLRLVRRSRSERREQVAAREAGPVARDGSSLRHAGSPGDLRVRRSSRG